MDKEQALRRKTKRLIVLFIAFLALSGITAFPLEWELSLLAQWTNNMPDLLKNWADDVYQAIRDTNARYPFLAYGTDWLAFAHLVIAVAFIGPLRDPVKNIWVIQFGMIACILVFPLAFVCGSLRHIPFYWQLIDCSFGLFGFIPLYFCHNYILQIEKLNSLNTK